MRYLLWLPFLLLLVGCATVAPTGNVAQDLVALQAEQQKQVAEFLTKLSAFTIADLQAASADAKAHNDPEFAMCWDGLQPIVTAIQAQGGNPLGFTPPKGAASLIQAVRDIMQGAGTASGATPLIVKQVNMACGPAYVAARADVLKVLIAVGLTASGAPGVGGLLGAVPAAVQPLLQLAPVK